MIPLRLLVYSISFIVTTPALALAADLVPGAGSILQQMQPVSPPAPTSDGIGLVVETNNATALSQGSPFEINRIEITGNSAFDATTVHALVADAEGLSLTLAQLGDIAARITAYYRLHGYPLARAIIPAQTIAEGVVHIQVIEARYGAVELTNRSRVADSLLRSTLAPLGADSPVTQAPLDRALIILTDVPGISISAVLRPGAAVGTSDLVVDAEPAPPITGNLALDNYGNRYTGVARITGTVNVLNPLHHGDALSLNALTAGDGLEDGGLSYETLLDGDGARLGGSFTALHYRLGDTLAALDGHGTAQVASLWLKTPFIRSLRMNIYGQLEYDHKKLEDRIDVAALHTDRYLNNLTASLNGDAHDTLLSGGISTWSVGWIYGKLNFDNDAAREADLLTARSQGTFSKWTANALRVQSFTVHDALYLTASAQWANSNLDQAEKMVAGGPYTVRAYDVGVQSGDTGVFGSAEFRHVLLQVVGGPLQAVAFFDVERVTINRAAWTTGTNAVSLRGTGLGFNWAGAHHWHARLSVATPVGSTPDLIADNKSVHAWAELGEEF